MKILTLNVHAWLEVDQMEKLQALIDILYDKDYDIIALQEVNQMILDPVVDDSTYTEPLSDPLNIPVKKSNFARVIVQKLRERGLTYYWSWTASHVGYDIFDEGIAILSKNPLMTRGFEVSESDKYEEIFRRVALLAKTDIDGVSYNILNTHLSWWKLGDQEYFKHEWTTLMSSLPIKEKLIVLGDFNNEANVEDEGYDYIKTHSPHLVDSYYSADEVTGEVTMAGRIDGWQDSEHGKRIDYIFTSDDLKPKTHHVVFNGENEPIVSDHFGIEITI